MVLLLIVIIKIQLKSIRVFRLLEAALSASHVSLHMCLVMYFDGVDANNVNLAHKRSERLPLVSGVSGIWT